MQVRNPGSTITFTTTFVNGNGDYYDPDEVSLRITVDAVTIAFGPFDDELENPSTGVYRYTFTVPTFLVPGIYMARWDGDDDVHFEEFQVIEPLPGTSELLDPPRIYGIMRDSSAYRDMGRGDTDQVFLIGHTSGLSINSPFQVTDMQRAINILGADESLPLVRALLEVYNAGGRDIWLMAAAPQSEYIPWSVTDEEVRFTPRPEFGGLNFYEQYLTRLQDSYDELRNYDFPDIIVPVEAPFYDTRGVDFLTPLLNYCDDAFTITGKPVIGVIGTRIFDWDDGDIEAMVEDERLADIGSAGKFVLPVVGEAIVNNRQMSSTYAGSMAATAAAALATSSLDRGLTYAELRNAMSVVGKNLRSDQILALARVKLNPVIRRQRGKRGEPYNVVLASDNTLAPTGSDFWSVVQMRLVAKVIARIRALGNRHLGSVGYEMFKDEVADFLDTYVVYQYMRDYDLAITKDPTDPTKAIVDVVLRPFFGIREIAFMVETGPGV